MRILRVFPKRTSYTPTDDLAFVGMPPMAQFIPEHDEVHVSCTFTWDMDECEDLAYQWEGATNKPVKLGGPAYHSPTDDFTPGLYVKKGIIFTSRGCNNWSEYDIPAEDVWKAIGRKPLFGHHSGKKSTTFWGCFMKGVE